MTCPVCHTKEAKAHPAFGVLPCSDCQTRRQANPLPDTPIEFTSAQVKDDRKRHLRSIIQPWRSGQLSKEYLDLYGSKGINATESEIAKAKPVWSDLANHDNLTKTI